MPAETQPMQFPQSSRQRTPLSWPVFLIAACALWLAYFLLRELLWARSFPLVHDAANMHYVAWMVSRGHAPYTWMVEMNLPGALMSEWASMRVFGMDAAGLWRWDTFVGLLAAGGAAWIAGRGYRLAGLCGAMFTWMLHLNDSAFDFGERDWLVAALFLLSTGCALEAMERRGSQAGAFWMAPCFGIAGWASAIKPQAVVLPVALLAMVLYERRRDRMARPILLWTIAGGLLPTLAVVLYFAHWPGAFAAFLHTERTIGAWYGRLGRATWHRMLLQVLLYPVLLTLALAVYLALRGAAWLRVRERLLLVGFACGILLYLLQRKGFFYHVYPFVLCAMVLGFVAAQRALVATWDRRAAAAVFLLLAALRLPVKWWGQHAAVTYPYGTQAALIADLQRLGGPALDGRVQCLDMTLGGCIGALYDQRLQQTTGYVTDNTLFPYPSTAAPFLPALQAGFLAKMEANPPAVIVLTAHNWPNQDDRQITKLERWPAFAAWLNQHYRVDSTHIATTTQHTASYRLYVLR